VTSHRRAFAVSLLTMALCAAGCSTSHSTHARASAPASAVQTPSGQLSPTQQGSAAASSSASGPVASDASPTPASSSVASPAVSAVASASNALPLPGPTGPLTTFATVTIKGAFAFAQSSIPVAEGPDGAIFVAGQQANPQIVWVVDGVGPTAGVAEHINGTVTALAADSANLYIATAPTIGEYSRTTGNLVRSWPTPSSAPGPASQLVVAGNRLWALFTTPDPNTASPTSEIVELDPQSTTPVRSVAGVTGVYTLAAGASSIYYVTDNSSKVVEQTNDGHTVTAPSGQPVNLQLSGPSAIQAVAVAGGSLVTQHDAGQGLDATLNGYDATTLAGPSASTLFSATDQLAETASGLIVVGGVESNTCGADQAPCVSRFDLTTGDVGSALALPANTESTQVVGPYPTVVLGLGSDLQVLRIS
jgi:hypothetical protein